MRHHSTGKHTTRALMVLLSLTMLMAAMLLTFGGRRSNATAGVKETSTNAPASAAQATQRPWTAIGSTGAVDETSLGLYAVNGAELGFKSPSSGNVIVARYNVTNTFDNNANPSMPGWGFLEMGSNAPLNCINSATLYRVKVCSRDPVAICTARNRSSDHPCAVCQFPTNTFDFSSYLYYVEVSLDRTGAPTAAPTVYTLRIY